MKKYLLVVLAVILFSCQKESLEEQEVETLEGLTKADVDPLYDDWLDDPLFYDLKIIEPAISPENYDLLFTGYALYFINSHPVYQDRIRLYFDREAKENKSKKSFGVKIVPARGRDFHSGDHESSIGAGGTDRRPSGRITNMPRRQTHSAGFITPRGVTSSPTASPRHSSNGNIRIPNTGSRTSNRRNTVSRDVTRVVHINNRNVGSNHRGRRTIGSIGSRRGGGSGTSSIGRYSYITRSYNNFINQSENHRRAANISIAYRKKTQPELDDANLMNYAVMDAVHILLDLGGLVPVAGEICDIVNGVIYTIRGDGLNASLSYASAVPLWGWFATGAKVGIKVAGSGVLIAVKGSSVILNMTTKQLQKKYLKHAADFGVLGNWNKAAASKFSSAINKHINSRGIKIIQGTYKNQQAVHYLNPKTGLNVISHPNGQFWSGWKLDSRQLNHVLKHGNLK